MIWSYPPTRKQLAATIGLFLTGASLSVYGAYMSLANIAPQQARAKARRDYIKDRLRKMVLVGPLVLKLLWYFMRSFHFQLLSLLVF
ncbi:hypothetical protein OIU79_011837 [Salix purpurea]|uniref:Uncharacterized protein n=1 Tax=Salix purpurea TaxID=77065 RepID=A0A9Q0T2U1_SALPP|nr:hypothetical protein OIU79_011837 [Salix purpurea]